MRGFWLTLTVIPAVIFFGAGCSDIEGDWATVNQEDSDHDDYGDDDYVDNDNDGWSVSEGDCDDYDFLIHPGAEEVCDGIDNDCTAQTMDGSGEPWFGQSCDGQNSDLSEDGVLMCVDGSQVCTDDILDDYVDNDNDGWSVSEGDCDDYDFLIHPGAEEVCDGIDNDCTAQTMDGSGEPWFGQSCDGQNSDLSEDGVLMCVDGAQVCTDDILDVWGQVTLGWDINMVPGLAGFVIYYGSASGDYAFSEDVGFVTSHTIFDLAVGRTYYFAATAYDIEGIESNYSNEVVYIVQ